MTIEKCQESALERVARKTGEHLDHRHLVLLFRWLLILVVVAFVFFAGKEGPVFSRAFPLVVAFIFSNIILTFFPRRFFTKLALTGPMVIIDIGFVTGAVYLSGNVAGDIYLLYFLTIFLAALSRDIKVSVLASVTVIMLYGLTYSWKTGANEFLTTAFLVKIPFFLLTAVFTGFLASQVKVKEMETEQATIDNVRLQKELTKSKRTEERAQEKLLELYQHNQNILESLNTGVLAVDADGVVTTFNAEATRITGIVRDSVVGKPIRELPDLSAFNSFLARVTDEGDVCPRDELSLRTAGGREIPMGISTSVLRDPQYEPRGAIAIFKDLTRLRDLERQLKRSERLAMLGEMAASVAHEIRNPLNSISGFAQLIGEKTDKEDRRRLFSQIIVEESNRIETIIADTLLFSREAPRTMDPVDINEVISSTVTRLSPKADDASVSVSMDLDPDLPRVAGNSVQLQQIFNNLIVNAIQAMADGGEILLATSTSDDSVVAIVSDTGPGMSSEVTDTIFHPFFTTKSEGTGLGLSICSKIAEDHHGNLEVESSPGQGATFKVTLPILHPEQESTQQPPSATVAQQGGQA